MSDYLIGIDGGGTATRAVVTARDGTVLGRGDAGPSALGQGVEQAWRHVELALRRAFESASVGVPSRARCALAAGLSGAGNAPWREAFIAANPGFGSLVVDTDSFAMLLGAHGGRPGVILIAGTGSVAEALRADGSRCMAGGWGFPVGDEGSGAWLGLQAVRHAQAAMDGRAHAGPLARQVWAHCGFERQRLQSWCDGAGQFGYAQLAPAVFEHEAQDPAAAQLIGRALHALDALVLAVDPRGRLPLVVSGSVGQRLASRLSPAVRSRLVQAAEGAADGALGLIRDHQTLAEAAL